MLKKGVGRNSLNVYLSFDGFLRRVFSLLQAGGFIYIALAWRHRFFLSKILFRFPPGDFGGSFNISYHFNYCPTNLGSGALPGVWHEIYPHLFTTTSLFKTDFLLHYFRWWKEGATSILWFWPIISLLSASFPCQAIF